MRIDLSGPEGNAWSLMGLAGKLGKALGHDAEWVGLLLGEMTSGDYTHLLSVLEESFPGVAFEFVNDPRTDSEGGET